MNDTIYEGQFKDNKIHGRGTCKYGKHPQDVYEGETKNNKFNGFGVNTYADGGVFIFLVASAYSRVPAAAA